MLGHDMETALELLWHAMPLHEGRWRAHIGRRPVRIRQKGRVVRERPGEGDFHICNLFTKQFHNLNFGPNNFTILTLSSSAQPTGARPIGLAPIREAL